MSDLTAYLRERSLKVNRDGSFRFECQEGEKLSLPMAQVRHFTSAQRFFGLFFGLVTDCAVRYNNVKLRSQTNKLPPVRPRLPHDCMRRFLVIWLLLVSFPAQALAVATGMHCASPTSRHPSGAVEFVAEGNVLTGPGAIHDHRGHGQAHHGATADHHESVAASGEGSPASMTDSGTNCSVCAACCAVSALPPTHPAEYVLAIDRQASVAIADRFDSATIPALERPPRA